MKKFISLCIFMFLLIGVLSLRLDCPPSSKMTTCSPKCKDDTECFGQKCCPNICNAKSCTAGNEGQNKDQKYSSSGATGSYCGNVKCNSYEKCELDRATKRQKCVRT